MHFFGYPQYAFWPLLLQMVENSWPSLNIGSSFTSYRNHRPEMKIRRYQEVICLILETDLFYISPELGQIKSNRTKRSHQKHQEISRGKFRLGFLSILSYWDQNENFLHDIGHRVSEEDFLIIHKCSKFILRFLKLFFYVIFIQMPAQMPFFN